MFFLFFYWLFLSCLLLFWEGWLFLLDWYFLCLFLGVGTSQLLFLWVLFLIVFVVLLFSCFYMKSDVFFYYFLVVLLVFVFSMGLLVLGKTSLHILLGWDLLGISSFFLVLYYNNWDSCTGAMSTVLVNRLGDFFMFLGVSLSVFSISFFSIMFLSVGYLLFLLLASFTKSAQFPFSGWLPKAMSAPTPVSSLVHSSTLVTAGLFLVYSFSFMVGFMLFSKLIMCFGMITMFFSNILAVYEKDLKKMVALSTMSQVGFCMFSLCLGFVFLMYFHVLSHAFFKSCLFMQVGVMIYKFFGQQDIRGYLQFSWLLGVIQFQFVCCLMSLCGMFFLGGLLSKDYIVEMVFMFSGGLLFFLFFIFVVWVTFIYSFYIFISLFFWGFLFFYFLYSVMGLLGTFFLYLFCVFFMGVLVNNLFFVLNFFLYLDIFFWFVYLLILFLMIFYSVGVLLKIIMFKFLGDYFFFSTGYFFKGLSSSEFGFGFIVSELIGVSMFLRSYFFMIFSSKFFYFYLLLLLFFFD